MPANDSTAKRSQREERKYLVLSANNNLAMIKNFLKIAYRNMLRRKGFSIINISGLAIGMASSLLIFLWVQNEMSHDRFHEKGKRIYLMFNRDELNGQTWAWSSTPKIMGTTLKKDFPEVDDVARAENRSFLCSVGEKKIHGNCLFTDSGFLKMFTFPLVKGSPTFALASPHNIVLTEKFAKILFGNEDPMGKTIKLDTSNLFTVSGVLKDLPNNTAFDFESLLPWTFLDQLKWNDDYWGDNSVATYVLLRPGVSEAAFNTKVKNITIDHTKASSDPSTTRVFAWPLNKVWLYSKNENGILVGGRVETVRLFTVIAIFILLIACINFMNLSTALSDKRGKEVGVRKVVGAQKSSLIAQFIGESILLTLLAGMVSLILVQLSLGSFNSLVNKQLHLEYGNIYFWLLGIAFILFTAILAGSYPAFFLSSFKPVKVLKGLSRSGNATINPRKILVVTQFSFAIILIISTIVVERQVEYAQSRDIGYSKNNLVFTFLEGNIDKKYDLIKQGLLNSGAAVAVTKSMSPITQRYSDSWGFSWEGSTPQDSKLDFVRMSTDADFVKAMGVTLVKGRDIDIKNYPGDSLSALLNETAVKRMRLKNPIGKLIKDGDQNWKVVGVVKDFVIESPYETISPMIINGPATWFNVMHYKLNPARPVATDLKLAEQVFKEFNPEYPFVYYFVEEAYAKKFEETQRTSTLAALFAGLTIFISCLGLFGLATYMAENRVKEIGVRKVLGANVGHITALLSKDFLKLILIAFVIAMPVAWYAMNQWLQSYTYRIPIEWWVFFEAGIGAALIALLSVSFQAIKAAVANPIKSLRTE
jgi:putative ABC transport system permease protein